MSDDLITEESAGRMYTALFTYGRMYTFRQFIGSSLNNAVVKARIVAREELSGGKIFQWNDIRIRVFDSTDTGNHAEVIKALTDLLESEPENIIRRYETYWRVVGKYNHTPLYDSNGNKKENRLEG